MKKVALLIIVFMVMTSCSSLSSTKSKSGVQKPIENTQWTLTDDVKGEKPTLSIESGRVSGNSGCNNYFGNVTVDPTAGNFQVGPVGSTRKACPNMSVENNYLKMLSEANKYVVNGDTLELYKDKLLLLKFTRSTMSK